MVIGEVGLAGEVRPVTQPEIRVRERRSWDTQVQSSPWAAMKHSGLRASSLWVFASVETDA